MPSFPMSRELRNSDGRQDTDDGYHNQDFNKRKARYAPGPWFRHVSWIIGMT
jgi:hypothetical protein